MEVIYILVPAGILLLSGTAILAFYWAARTGQFRNLKDGSKVIFDEDEPIGRPTDTFPGMEEKTARHYQSSKPSKPSQS